MAIFTSRSITLSVTLLLASTSLANAGFIWLSPEKQGTEATTTYSQQAEPAVPADANSQGRAWKVDPAVPVAGTASAPEPAPVLAQAPVAAPVEPTVVAPVVAPAPVELAATTPTPAVEAPVVVAPAPVELAATAPVVAPAVEAPAAVVAPPAVTLGGEAMSAKPIYSKGDRMPAPVVAAPVPAPVAEVVAPVVAPAVEAAAPAPAAPAVEAAAVVAPAPAVTAPVEVKLASSKDLTLQNGSTAPAMTSAQQEIDKLPSMTAPKDTATAPAPAPSADLIGATAIAQSKPVVEAPAPKAPEAPVAAVVAAPAPAATVSAVADLSSAKPIDLKPATSPITGETVAVASAAETTAFPAPGVPAAPVAMTPTDKVLDGFGKHVPLVIALRQILPSDYGFAHGDGVDLTASIDWQGGRPWSQVLSDSIKPLGLTAIISNDTVMLVKVAAAPAEAAKPVEAAAAVVVAPAATTVAAGATAVLTNATVMQTPPKNN